MATRNLAIRGISLHRSYSGSATYTGLIELKEDATNRVITSQRFSYLTNADRSYVDQLFDTPGNVVAGVKYTITLTYDAPISKIWRGTDGLATSSADCGGVTVDFAFSDAGSEDTNGSGPIRGQIPRILFNC